MRKDKPDIDAMRPPGTGLGGMLREADLAFQAPFRTMISTYNVSVAEYQHLRRLWDSDGMSQRVLSQQINIKDASSTGTLDRLEQKGLIYRQRSPDDRRKISVFLTEAGKSLRPPLINAARELNSIAFSGLDPAEVETFMVQLRKIIVNLQNLDARPAPDDSGL